MNTRNQEPARSIAARILATGPISFAEFMQLALYHPEGGYYVRDRPRVGRAGDFFTNVSVGTTFGEVLADQCYEAFVSLGRPAGFTVVEQGAESGQLAADITRRLTELVPVESADWRYVIVEPQPKNRTWQAATLKESVIAVRWVDSLADLSPFTGVMIAHELLDAFPCHWIEFTDGAWQELRVTIAADRFVAVSAPISDFGLAVAVQQLPRPVTVPYRTEINLAARAWVRSLRGKLRAGVVLIVDYGYPRWEYYDRARTEGTLTGYSRHRRMDSVLEQPGEIDITAHLDFTALAEAAETADLQVLGFTDQHHFMISAAENRLRAIERAGTLTPDDRAFIRGFRSLMHPATMGLAFKYLLLGQAPFDHPLSGFRYSSDPKTALGIGSHFS